MTIIIVHIMLISITLSHVVHVAMSSKIYEAKLELFNKVSKYEPLENKYTAGVFTKLS